LYGSSLKALHANDIVNVIGVGVGAFILLVNLFKIILKIVLHFPPRKGNSSKFTRDCHFSGRPFDKCKVSASAVI